MSKAIGVAMLVAGIPLVIYGFKASDSVISDVSRFTGAPTTNTIWLLLGGSVLVALGMAMIFQRSSKV